MKIIRTEIIINNTAQNVWNILIDFASYPNWNPFITMIEGKLSIGEKLSVTIEPEKSKKMTFRPIIIQYEESRLFTWKGKFLIHGLFDGTHRFEIVRMGKHEMKLIHEETFSGILVPFMKTILDKTQSGFEAMNLALKNRAETHP